MYAFMHCCAVQVQWAPIQDSSETCVTAMPSPNVLPDVNNTTPTLIAETSTSRPATVVTATTRSSAVLTPVQQRSNPLPVFEWADSRQMWDSMMLKEELPGYHRDAAWFRRHALLQPRMRTVLLDWLMEVISRLISM